MRRASLAGLEAPGIWQYRQAPGGSFGRRLSLSTLGSGKYGRAGDSYGDGDRVIVRHVPIVIEEGEGESEEEKEVKVSAIVSQPSYSVITDDLSSLSSMSSDNSVETGRRKEGGGMEGSEYQSLDDWRRKRGRKHGVVGMGGDRQLRTPFKDIKQLPDEKHKTPVPRPDPRARPGPWYVLKTETVGVESCPVHGEGMGSRARKDKKPGTMDHAYGELRTPSIIPARSEEAGCKLSTTTAGRPKHSEIPTQLVKTGNSETDINIFERGPGRWSSRGTSSKPPSDTQKDEKEIMEKSRNSNPTFQRRWSFRAPSVTPDKKSSDIPSSFYAPTLASLSRSLGDNIPEYFRGTGSTGKEKKETPTGKYPSQFLSQLNSSSLTSFNSRSTPSFSTSSIPSKISQSLDQIGKDNSLSTGILRTPGKRKVSSNNRVEFLNNIMEREIPGRHT